MTNLLDGKKTYIGIVLVVGYYVAKYYNIPIPESVRDTGYGMAAVGIAHKLEKIKDAVEVVKGVKDA